MLYLPLNPDECVHLDTKLSELGLNRGQLAERSWREHFLERYTRDESVRGVINNWARGHSNLPDHFVRAIEIITGRTIADLIGRDEIEWPGEIDENLTLVEGSKKSITVNAYERNLEGRRKCLKKFGYKCSVCSMDFEKVYGSIGRSFIHVHHLVEISSIGREYSLVPIRDLRPVCPNCHAMLHKRRPAYTIEELQEILRNPRPERTVN